MACLGQLPPELMLRIIQYTDNSSLRSLRTACRSLSTFATPELFKTVTLSVAERRSHACVESILGHPVLRSCVRKLWVDIWEDPELVSSRRTYGPEVYPHWRLVDFIPKKFEDLMLRLKEFANLRHVNLCFGDYCTDELLHELNPDLLPEIFGFFLSSVLSLDHPPLELGFQNVQYIHNLDGSHMTMLKQLLGNLTSLRLNVRNTDVVSDIGDPDFDPEFDRFYILCSQIPFFWLKPASSTLRHLALYSGDNFGFNPKLNFRGVHFPHLESLALGNFCFFCDSQLDWILSHRSTLRELYLDHCPILSQVTIREAFLSTIETRVTYGKRWHDYFRAFQEELPLLRHFMYGVSSDWYGKWMIPFEEEHTIKIGLYEDSYGTLLSGNWTSEHPDCRDEDDWALEALLRKTGQQK
ncbi:hypothetical protein FQN55_001313 [Onygenales sp. PD_40]|nr:hypothetical protein FQN55_001313 [Onygenales sp. PD_40]KAK2770959.1 hypothetical protein FQN53_005276 [Emmonsiellopsis sp. PD_33]